MTPSPLPAPQTQVWGWARLMMRSISGGTKTIRSRIGSRGSVVISTITVPSLRRSAIPPRAPAGAESAGSLSSTRSPIARSSMVAIPSSVGLGISGDQPRCGAFVLVMPCRKDKSDSVIDPQCEEDAIGDGAALSTQPRDRSLQYGFGNRIPDEITVSRSNVENTPPFIAVPVLAENPVVQLALCAPSVRCTGKAFANSRGPRHCPDARDRNFTRVRLRSIFRSDNQTKLEQGQ